ncbi:MAG TPA: superinfection exclusion B family protein [Agitococcus sp.]|nr:superinfection exclusion B family protein [Agitococcus sp.]
MGELLAKFIEIIQLPIKYLLVFSALSGFLIFSPESYLNYFGLQKIAVEYKTWISITFLVLSLLLVIEVVYWCWGKIDDYFSSRNLKKELQSELLKLDNHEKAVIREFYLQGKNTLQLPLNHPTIARLFDSHFLILSSTMAEKSLAGVLASLSINPEIKDYITYSLIDLPKSPTSEQIQWLKDNRPDFVAEIAHHNNLFHSYKRTIY